MVGDHTTLMPSKLRPPRLRSDAVPRPRLVERVRECLAAALVLVAAPAGAGKTTLLVEALDTLEIAYGWIALDEADNEPRRFARYLLAAARKVVPGLTET